MALDWVGDEGHTTAALTQRKKPGTYCTEDWEGLMASLEEYGEKRLLLPGFELRNVNSLACLYTDYPVQKLHWEVSKYVVNTNRLFVATQIYTCVSQERGWENGDTAAMQSHRPSNL